MIEIVVFFILSLICLYFGAEWSLHSAEKIGLKFGLSPLIVGMVIIGLGTSLPELFVCHLAAWSVNSDLAIGNIIGSNIANTYLILGLCAALTPIALVGRFTRDQLIIHGLLSIAMLLCFRFKILTWLAVLPLTVVLVTYLVITFRSMKTKPVEELVESIGEKLTLIDILKLLVGFFLLYLGGELLVYSGSAIASSLGWNAYFVSVIFFALGTSLPELMTSILAIMKKRDSDLILGNILGSNIFNAGLILTTLAPYRLPLFGDRSFELTVFAASTLVLLILFYLRKKIDRVVGLSFIGVYGLLVYHWSKVLN